MLNKRALEQLKTLAKRKKCHLRSYCVNISWTGSVMRQPEIAEWREPT